MRERALTAGMHAPRLLQAAQELEDAVTPPAGEEWSAKRLLGAWARARILWRDVTGEPLV